MRVLVAPPSDTPRNNDDFIWTTPGEVLIPFTPCDAPSHGRDCGCDRAFAGLDSLKGTTIGTVADRDDAELRRYIGDSKHLKANHDSTVESVLDDLNAIATSLPEEAVPGERFRLRPSMTDIDFLRA